MKKFSALILVSLLAACSFTPRDTGTAFMFALQPVEVTGQGAAKDSLIVFTPTTSPELDTHRIALNNSSKRWDYYAGAKWSDFLPLLVQDSLTKTLEQSQLFKSVSTGDSGLTGDKILKTEIRAFQAEYVAGSKVPVIKIRMIVSLVSRMERKPLASFSIKAEKRADADTLPAVQAAFAAAFSDAEKQIVEKLEKITK